jgi:muramoyltetrapeptide carboxypeptidase
VHIPKLLQPGDRIRIIAPSGSFARDVFDAGVEIIKAYGYEPVFGEGLFARYRYLAGDDARRAAELNEALQDSSARAIWTARGGYGATRILPSVSSRDIESAGKWLIGFSDATALHSAWLRANVASLHGANVTTLSTWSEQARDELFAWLSGTRSSAVYRGRCINGEGLASGPVFGGNLTVIAALIGTEFMPSLSGAVVLLEDIGERPYRLDRTLTQMVQSGAFAGVVGFAIGQLTDCGPTLPNGEDALDIVQSVLAPLGVPIVADLPIGHEATSRALPLAATAILDADHGELRVGWR